MARTLVVLVLLLSGASLLSPQPTAGAPKRVYVNDDSPAGINGDGTSWKFAYNNLAAALFVATGPVEFWVAEGTYTPDWLFPGNRTQTFGVGKDQEVYGGFDGTEDAREQRDPVAHPTVLSGDVGTVGLATDNVYHVVLITLGAGESAVLDGFTVTGGYNDFGGDYRGGGIDANGGAPVLANLAITGNTTDTNGGAAVTLHSSNATIHGGRFDNNVTVGGTYEGGLWAYGSDVTIEASVFQRNPSSDGDAIQMEYSPSLSLTGSSISASGRHGTGAALGHVTSATIRATEFEGFSMAIFANYTTLHLDSSLVQDSTIGIKEGGNIPAPNVMVANSTFSGVGTGAIINQYGQGTVTYSTFDGPGGTAVTGSSVFVDHSIVWGMAAAGNADAASFDNDILQSGCPPVAACTRSVAGDPLLRPLSDNGGPTPTMALGVGGAAIDATVGTGCPTTDQRGDARPVDGDGVAGAVCDLGAFELDPAHVAFATASSAVAESAGSANIDVVLDKPAPEQVTVTYGATGGTADGGGVDYTLNPGSLTFPAGTTTQTFAVAIVADGKSEADETVVIALSAPGNALLGQAKHTLIITGTPATLAFDASAPTVTEDTRTVVLRVRLSRPLPTPASAKIALQGSATPLRDYRVSTTRVRIPAGATLVQIEVHPVDDFLVEAPEQAKLVLTAPVNAVVGARSSITIVINDNEPRLKCAGRPATIVGTRAGETIIGTAGADVIAARGGADIVMALDGNDRVCAGGGNDTVDGGDGRDLVLGNAGNDILRLGQGGDTGRGGGGADQVRGGDGNDSLAGGGGTDVVSGEGGKDHLSGGPGAGDRCDGGPGVDALLRNAGCETVVGVP